MLGVGERKGWLWVGLRFAKFGANALPLYRGAGREFGTLTHTLLPPRSLKNHTETLVSSFASMLLARVTLVISPSIAATDRRETR